MRRFLIPLVFVALLAVATVVPVAANSPGEAPDHSGKACGANLWSSLITLVSAVCNAACLTDLLYLNAAIRPRSISVDRGFFW